MGASATEPPIAALLPAIRAALAEHNRLVLEAPPGAGKTTAVPPALPGCDWLGDQRIVMLEPRRLAARAAAGFMAAQRGEAVGQTVGYRIRFDNKVSDATRIEVVTEGIFTRMLQADPTLDGVGAVLFDEFHERHLPADLGLALALDVQQSLRPELRLVLMSATLDGEAIADRLGAPRLASEGRSFPVAVRYPAARRGETPLSQLARLLPQALREQAGDVLVFLPGQREIMRAERLLQGRIEDPDVLLLPLHGGLPLSRQRAALQPAAAGTRHVILATNVAESSVTLPGIRTVIDLGLVRAPRFDPRSGLTRLETGHISQASADQRAGRAGRVAPGQALRLWPESRRLERQRRAEIEQADLSALALELAAWGSAELNWLTPPPAAALAQARDLLQQLGALDADRRITPLGRRMLASGAAPRLAAAICAAEPAQHGLVADLLALLESRSPLRGRGSDRGADDDLRQRLALLHAWRDGGHQAIRGGGDAGALVAIEKVAEGWRRRLRTRQRPSGTPGRLQAGNLLLPAFPDRVARADPGNPHRYKLANGRGARLGDHSSLLGEPWLLAVDVPLERGDSRIRTALPFDPDQLETVFPQAFSQRRQREWNDARQTLEGFAERRFGELLLARERVALDADERQAALLEAVQARGLGVLPWDRASRNLCRRIECARRARPQLPATDDASLQQSMESWLGPWLAGCKSLSDLSPTSLLEALRARLDYAGQQQLDRLTPERVQVPSGHRHRIDYSDPAAPVLAVKLQEMFGLSTTPSINQGALPLTLHLLSPAGRSLQVTSDLASFWKHGYADVRKDMRGRYPKHPWPEDPLTATPSARTKRRR